MRKVIGAACKILGAYLIAAAAGTMDAKAMELIPCMLQCIAGLLSVYTGYLIGGDKDGKSRRTSGRRVGRAGKEDKRAA